MEPDDQIFAYEHPGELEYLNQILVPVKNFLFAKSRLSGSFDEKKAIVIDFFKKYGKRMLAVVEDPITFNELSKLNIAVVGVNKKGLNESLSATVHFMAKMKVKRVSILHSDVMVAKMPLITYDDLIVIGVDKNHTGTNFLSLPTNIEFLFQFGEDSFVKHLNYCISHDYKTLVVTYSPIGFDIDTQYDKIKAGHLKGYI
jgi:2-phospho-L-lactate guanylyltransferase (CobY/MobA/RfbA family)